MSPLLWLLVLAPGLQSQESQDRLKAGQEKLKVRDFDSAIPEFEQCLKLDPEQFNAHFGLGSCFWEKLDYARSRVHFLKVVEIVEKQSPDATLTGVHQKLLGCHLLLEDFEGAIAEATRLIKVQPTAEYYYDRALARQRKGDSDGALEDSAAALKENSGMTKARTLRAAVFVSRDDKEAALKELAEAIQLKPGDHAGYLGRGCVYYFLGNWLEAEADLKSAGIKNKGLSGDLDEQGYSVALLWLVRVRTGLPEGASDEVKSFRRLLKDLRKDPSKDHLLGLPLHLAGDVPEADLLRSAEGATFRKAQALCEVCFFIGERKLLAGDKAGAKQYFLKGVASGARGNLEYDLSVRRLKELGD